MTSVTVELPDETFSALRRSPEEMPSELRLAAAIHWYTRGLISQERAALIAGMERMEFLMTLAREKIEVIQVDMEEIKREASGGLAS